MGPIRWRSSLAGQVDCGFKTKLFLANHQPSAGWSGPVANGIKLHKQCEDYLLEGTEPEEPCGWWKKVKGKLDALYPVMAGVEWDLAREDGDFFATGKADFWSTEDEIWDWKFTGKPWDARRFLSYAEKQGDLYLWLMEGLLGYAPKRLVYYVVPQNGPPQEWPLDWNTQRIENNLRLWKSQLQEVRAKAEFNMWQHEPTPFKCKWCLYKADCESAIN